MIFREVNADEKTNNKDPQVLLEHRQKIAELIPDEVMSSFLRRREIWLNLLQQEEEAKRRLEQVLQLPPGQKLQKLISSS